MVRLIPESFDLSRTESGGGIESSNSSSHVGFPVARLPAPYTASAPARCNMYSQYAADFEELVGAPPS